MSSVSRAIDSTRSLSGSTASRTCAGTSSASSAGSSSGSCGVSSSPGTDSHSAQAAPSSVRSIHPSASTMSVKAPMSR